jgi:hypothetical protein
MDNKYSYGDIAPDGKVYYRKNGLCGKIFLSPEEFIRRLNDTIIYKRKLDKRKCRLEARINKYKQNKGCAKCGYKASPHALCFDHLKQKNKEHNVSLLIVKHRRATLPPNKKKARKRVFQEIRKCQILCANCHYIKTFEERAKSNKVSRRPLYKDIEDYLKRNPGKKNYNRRKDNRV